MFTGIVEEIGSVKAVKRNGPSLRLTLSGKVVLEDVKLGDSISVNGICLTVTTFDRDSFSVDVMPETLKASSLDGVRPGTSVNLERAMPANGRFGGHFVSGHVDGVGVSSKNGHSRTPSMSTSAVNHHSSAISSRKVRFQSTGRV